MLTAGDAIKAFFKAYHLEDKILEVKIVSACDKVLGTAISKQLETIRFRNHILTLSLRNAALRQELEYRKSVIMQNINEEMGPGTVTKVVIR